MRGTRVRDQTDFRLRQTLYVFVVVSLVIVAGGLASEPVAANVSSACSNGATFEPADGNVIHIIGQDTEAIDDYVEATGIVPAGLMTYTNLAAPVGLVAPWEAFGSGNQHASYLLEQYPESAIQLGIYMKDYLDETNQGLLDANIVALAEYVKNADVPFFIRPGYEFDGAHNGFRPGPYKAAYRRIVDVFRDRGVTNVAWVWHGQGRNADPDHLALWYPGDGYVDWAAISFFSHPFDDPALAGAHAMADFAADHDKPMMIAESTPRGLGADSGQRSWDEWFVPLFDFIEQRGVKALSYINADWESNGDRWSGWGDSRVQSDPYVFEHWMEEIEQPQHVKASPTLFCEPATTTLTTSTPETAYATDQLPLRVNLATTNGPVRGQPVTVTVGDLSTITLTTDEAGNAETSIRLDLDPGSHPVTATFDGDDGHSPSSATTSVQVLADPTELAYTGQTTARGESVAVSAVLTDDDGNPLVDQPVTFTMDSAETTAVTDDTGRAAATMTATDHGRSQEVEVNYRGAQRYEPSTTTATVTWGGSPDAGG